jgi:phage baseplate assembly protein W
MSLQGATLGFPVRADVRGTLAAVSAEREVIEQAIRDVIETRQGERVMLPDYGLPDFVFAVAGAGFAARLAYWLELQIQRYVPGVGQVTVTPGALDGDEFTPGLTAAPQRVAVRVAWRGGEVVTAPLNLVFPVWQLS